MGQSNQPERLKTTYINVVKSHPVFRRIIILAIQTALAAASYYFAYLLRFDFNLPSQYLAIFLRTLPILLVIRLITFFHRYLFSTLWRYTTLRDVVTIIKVNLFGSMIFGGVLILFYGRTFSGVPRSVFVIDFILVTAALILMRIMVKRIHQRFLSESPRDRLAPVRVAIIDAGPQGIRLAREILENPLLNYELAGFFDEDIVKRRSTILGLPVLGGITALATAIVRDNIDEVLIVQPEITAGDITAIRETCSKYNTRVKSLPTTKSLIDNLPLTSQMHISELEGSMGRAFLGEESEARSRPDHSRQVVLVTGAAGSIGSELCRQIAQQAPKRLVSLDQNESGLFNVGQALKQLSPDSSIELVVGDITNQAKMNAVFQQYKPDCVYHTAAYKHVPLMENEPIEAVTTNVVGTYHLLQAAEASGCRCFVFISTDKAVNPESIMGMTKFLAERLVSGMQRPGAKALSVRFGNVLESSGSVLPLFRQQVEHGGPVTVTHPEVTRYFMSISEAVYLVQVAAEMGSGGEVFLLKMGNPIKIVDLAKKVITAAGLLPDRDIEIVYTGLRPGERLHEPLYWEGENINQTMHPNINVMTQQRPDVAQISRWIKDIAELCQSMDKSAVAAELARFTKSFSGG